MIKIEKFKSTNTHSLAIKYGENFNLLTNNTFQSSFITIPIFNSP